MVQVLQVGARDRQLHLGEGISGSEGGLDKLLLLSHTDTRTLAVWYGETYKVASGVMVCFNWSAMVT